MISSNSDLPGVEVVWGGKLPSHGDFLWSQSRNALRVRLEDWLQAGMLQGRSQYGDAWREFVARAPLWNFLAPANALYVDCMVVGCIAPSCDRVGRQYPFVVGYAFPREMLLGSPALVTELPTLVTLLGYQMYSAIERAWPRTVLDSIWANVLAQWRRDWPCDILPTAQRAGSGSGSGTSTGSDILDVLGQSATSPVDEMDMSTRPAARESTYPWPDVPGSLRSANGPSFWWTHPAGGAPLKALAYENPLDGQLMTWLWGRGGR